MSLSNVNLAADAMPVFAASLAASIAAQQALAAAHLPIIRIMLHLRSSN
jgi:hypothetical protein